MNLNEFYNDVVNWINECNRQAVNLGMESESFWNWVMFSIGELSNKYNNELATMQLVMLVEWLEKIYFGNKRSA